MNLKVPLFAFLLLFLFGFKPASTPAPATEEPLQLQLMLADKAISLPLPPYCGIIMTDVVVRFKVTKVLHGFYLGSTILIHEKCLREAIESGAIGDHGVYVYKLKKRPVPFVPLMPKEDKKAEDTYDIIYF